MKTVVKLRLIYLCLGMMFWYGIEQLFLDTVLRDAAARTIITIVYTASLLAFDIPGGIIADRFGRRRSLLLGTIVLIASLTVFAFSTSVATYAVGSALFGLYWALCNGTVQAFLYDHLHEKNEHHLYARQLGMVSAYGYIGAGIANIASGIIAHFTDLRMPYLLSIIPALFALYLAYSLNEQRHSDKDNSGISLRPYITSLYTTIVRRPIVLIYVLQYSIGLVLFLTICEYGQIYLLSHGVTAVTLGILWAAVAGVAALALYVAHFFQNISWWYMIGFSLLALIFANSTGVVGVGLFIALWAGTCILENIADTHIQHNTKSTWRATVMSSVTFLSNAISIPIIWWFGSLQQARGIEYADSTMATIIAGLLISTVAIYYVAKLRFFRFLH